MMIQKNDAGTPPDTQTHPASEPEVSAVSAVSASETDGKTIRMPAAVPYIVGNETAERFSYYGMNTILMVYMTDAAFLAMTEKEAAGYIHLFKGAVYFFPLIGAFLADVFCGKFRVMFWLSIVYCLGHLALALPGSVFGGNLRIPLFLGLTLIALGSGGIKSCTSAIVGDQFTSENHHLINVVYNWFYLGINVGSFVSTLLTPWLLVNYGPEWAFGVPGVLMGIATLILWLGRHKYRVVKPSGIQFLRELKSREGLTALGKVSVIFLFLIIFWAVYDQTSTLWVEQAKVMNAHIFAACTFLPESLRSFEVLPSQLQAVNPFLILVLIPTFTCFIYPFWNRHFGESALKKISVGLFLVVLAQCFPLWFETMAKNNIQLNIAWQIPAYFVLTVGEVLVSVTSLEFAYTQAPRSMKSIVMGVYLLTITAGNFLVARVNFLRENNPAFLPGDAYYRFFLLMALANALIFMIVIRFYREKVFIQE